MRCIGSNLAIFTDIWYNIKVNQQQNYLGLVKVSTGIRNFGLQSGWQPQIAKPKIKR